MTSSCPSIIQTAFVTRKQGQVEPFLIMAIRPVLCQLNIMSVSPRLGAVDWGMVWHSDGNATNRCESSGSDFITVFGAWKRLKVTSRINHVNYINHSSFDRSLRWLSQVTRDGAGEDT